LSEAISVLKTVYDSLPKPLKLPIIEFPYSNETQNFFVISNKILKNTDFKCKICPKTFKQNEIRIHVAKHILTSGCVRSCCGYCGLACNSVLKLERSSGYGINTNFKPFSNCTHFYEFSLAPVEKVGDFCSNRPIICKICREVFWSYNMRFQFEDHHKGTTLPLEYIIPDKEIRNIKTCNKF